MSVPRDVIRGIGETKVVGEDRFVTVLSVDGIQKLIEVTTPYTEAVERVWTSQPAACGVVWRKPGEAGRVNGKLYLVIRDGDWADFVWNEGHSHDGWCVEGVVAWAELPPLPDWAKGGA